LDDLPLFPIAIVLLPQEDIPLHIFEPRYRELTARCLERDEPFAIVLEDDAGQRSVGCTARMVRVDRMPDGLSHLATVLPSGALGEALRAALIDARLALRRI